MKKILLFCFLLSAPSLFAEEGLKVYAYGSGEVLQQIFNLVAVICGGKFSGYDTAIWIAVTIGLLYAVIMAMNKMDFSPIWKQWLLPVFLTFSILTVSSERVIICDYLIKTDAKQKVYTVDNVPILLAYTAHFFSSLSYGMSSMLESAAHLTSDPLYNWTGNIYAGKSLFNTRNIKIIDAVTEENFRTFCSECVFRDLGLGLYTKEEIRKAPDLLAFLESRTSSIRGMPYRQPDHSISSSDTFTEGEKNLPAGSRGMLTCRRAISLIRKHLSGQLANTKELLEGSIGDTASYLIDKSAKAPIEKLAQQQMAIDTLKNYTGGRYDDLAAKRAEQQQIASQKILGAMGATILVSLRNYLEAFLYGVFPLVVLVSLFSLGFRVLLGWVQIIAWISFWPPCFVIANFFLDVIWTSKKGSWGLAANEYSLSMSEGLFTLYEHMEGIACAMFVSIPFISWALLYLSKGGASSLVHWASSFTSATQGSASLAASEEVTGNYSYKNVGLSSQNIGNATRNQKNLAPLFMGGTVTTQDAYGRTTTDDTGEMVSIDARKSNLLTDIAQTDSFTNSVQSHLKEAESLTASESAAVSQNIAHTVNAAEGLNKHLSHSSNESTGWDTSHLSSLQKQAQKVYNQAEEYGKTYSMDTKQAYDEALKAGAGIGLGIKASVDGSLLNQFSQGSGEQKSERFSDAVSLYQSMQNLSQSVHREGGNLSEEEGARKYQDFASSFNKVASSSEQLQSAYTTQKSLESLASGIESQDLRVSENLNNAFISHLEETVGDKELIHRTLAQPAMRQRAIDGFIRSLKPDISFPSSRLEGSLQEEYRANKEGFTTPSSWEEKIDAAQKEATSLKETLTSEVPDQEGLGARNLAKLESLRQESLPSLQLPNCEDEKERAKFEEKFQPLADKDKGKEWKPLFKEAKDRFNDSNERNFFIKIPKNTTVWKTVETVGKLFQVPEPKTDKEGNKIPAPPHDPKITAWSELKDKDKIAVIDTRINDYLP